MLGIEGSVFGFGEGLGYRVEGGLQRVLSKTTTTSSCMSHSLKTPKILSNITPKVMPYKSPA